MLAHVREFDNQYGRMWTIIFGLFFVLGILVSISGILYLLALNLDYIDDDYENLNIDWKVFTTAADNLADNEPIYTEPDYTVGTAINYRYAPPFALFVGLFIDWLAFDTWAVIWLIVNIILYVFIALYWYKALAIRATLFATALYLLTSIWNTDLQSLWYFGNITGLLMFLAAVIVLWIKDERYIPAGIITGLILLTKPHWAFPAVLALISVGSASTNLRSSIIIFLKSGYFQSTIATYIATMLVFLMAKSLGTGLDYLKEYFSVLIDISANYDYADPGELSLEHGLSNTLHRIFGNRSWLGSVALLIKLSFLISFIWALRRVIAVGKQRDLGNLVLVGGYLTAMFMIPEMQELILTPVVFFVLWSGGNRVSQLIILPTLVYVMYALPSLTTVALQIDVPLLSEILPISLITLVLLYSAFIHEIYRLTQSPKLVKAEER